LQKCQYFFEIDKKLLSHTAVQNSLKLWGHPSSQTAGILLMQVENLHLDDLIAQDVPVLGKIRS
jgi:hypothetical protein